MHRRIPRDKFFFLSLVSCLLAAGWTSFRDGKIRDTVSPCSFRILFFIYEDISRNAFFEARDTCCIFGETTNLR